jgi:hypothetical protein
MTMVRKYGRCPEGVEMKNLITCLVVSLLSSAAFAYNNSSGSTLDYTIGFGKANFPTFDSFFQYMDKNSLWQGNTIQVTLLNDVNWASSSSSKIDTGSSITSLEIRSSDGNQWNIYSGSTVGLVGNSKSTFALSLDRVVTNTRLFNTTWYDLRERGYSNTFTGDINLSFQFCEINATLFYVEGYWPYPNPGSLYINDCQLNSAVFNGYLFEDSGWDQATIKNTNWNQQGFKADSLVLNNVVIGNGFDGTFEGNYNSNNSIILDNVFISNILTNKTCFRGAFVVVVECSFISVDINDEESLFEVHTPNNGDQAFLTMQDCLFEDCSGILIDSSSMNGYDCNTLIADTNFKYCIPLSSNGICDLSGQVFIEGCVFEDNIGKVVRIKGTGTNADILDSTFRRNWEESLFLEYDGDCNVSNSDFSNNNGTAIYSSNSLPFISSSAFCGNDVDIYGPWIDKGDNTWLSDCDNPAFCFADVNEDYNVDVLDLLYVIAVWGTDNPAGDINEDGWVDVSDLLEVISAWGVCP